jgi:hypothetical protein
MVTKLSKVDRDALTRALELAKARDEPGRRSSMMFQSFALLVNPGEVDALIGRGYLADRREPLVLTTLKLAAEIVTDHPKRCRHWGHQGLLSSGLCQGCAE